MQDTISTKIKLLPVYTISVKVGQMQTSIFIYSKNFKTWSIKPLLHLVNQSSCTLVCLFMCLCVDIFVCITTHMHVHICVCRAAGSLADRWAGSTSLPKSRSLTNVPSSPVLPFSLLHPRCLPPRLVSCCFLMRCPNLEGHMQSHISPLVWAPKKLSHINIAN